MRRWRYIEPGEQGAVVEQVVTEAEILATYYPYWKVQMRKVGKEAQITEAACIEDWVVVHWAEELAAGLPDAQEEK